MAKDLLLRVPLVDSLDDSFASGDGRPDGYGRNVTCIQGGTMKTDAPDWR